MRPTQIACANSTSNENGPEPYARLVTDTVAALMPATVLEFGCGSGRNLAVLRELSEAALTGIDINRTAIAWGQQNFRLDLHVGVETWIAAQGQV